MSAAVSVTSTSFSVGAVQEISQIRVPQPGLGLLQGGYDVFPDGQRFIVSALKPEALRAPLTLITNWPAALSK
jgi:hypothetical protein